MDYGQIIQALENMVMNLAAEVKNVQIENSRLKDEIMALRASVAIAKGNTDASEKAIDIIKANDMVCDKTAIHHFNTLALFNNSLDETTDIGKQR